MQAQVFKQVKTNIAKINNSFYSFSALSTINCNVLACRLNRHFLQPSRNKVSLYSKTGTGRFVHSLTFLPCNLIFKADDHPIFPLQTKPNFFLPFFFFEHLTYLFSFFTDNVLDKTLFLQVKRTKGSGCFMLRFFSHCQKKSGVESRNCHLQKDCLFGSDNEEPQHQLIKQASLESFGNRQKNCVNRRTRIIEMKLNKLYTTACIQRSIRICPLYQVFMDRKRIKLKTPHTA